MILASNDHEIKIIKFFIYLFIIITIIIIIIIIIILQHSDSKVKVKCVGFTLSVSVSKLVWKSKKSNKIIAANHVHRGTDKNWKGYECIQLLVFSEQGEQLDTYFNIILDWNISFLTILCIFLRRNFKVPSYKTFFPRDAD